MLNLCVMIGWNLSNCSAFLRDNTKRVKFKERLGDLEEAAEEDNGPPPQGKNKLPE